MQMAVSDPRYDTIGSDYSRLRREDPRIAARLHAALGDATSVVNVGAGAGSYEPADRYVIAVEPSGVMAAQRPPGRAPAIRARADRLPLFDDSVDAAMAVLAVHHWDAEREAGVRELRRVARGAVVLLTVDPVVSAQMWLMRDYLTEVAALDREIFPSFEQLSEWLGGCAHRARPGGARYARPVAVGLLGPSRARPRSGGARCHLGLRAYAPGGRRPRGGRCLT